MPDARRHCSRCTGRLFLDPDADTGDDWVCLLCSRRYPVVPLAPLPLVNREPWRVKRVRSA